MTLNFEAERWLTIKLKSQNRRRLLLYSKKRFNPKCNLEKLLYWILIESVLTTVFKFRRDCEVP